ncbi:MAG: ABC transporter ATP-binding protein [Acidobacteriia bacterium]|nr:ABC transporter ATP-binding protein [Terriglobia bacterium]
MTSSPTPPPLLAVEALESAYGAVQVLWGVSFNVPHGQIVTIIGSNGAGKTTTLNTIIGVMKLRGGRILFKGEDIGTLPPHERVKRHISLVPEGRHLWPRMSAEDNLLMGAYQPSLRRDARRNLTRVYDLFPRLKERRSQLAGTLSGGEQQMCALGRGLMAEPELLMLDEPSLGLAPKLVDEIFAHVEQICKQGVTILLVAQNVSYALQMSETAYLMETGRITLSGPSRSLATNKYVVEAYIGKA